MTQSTRRVLIAGGGIGGLALANQLCRSGVPVTVFERASELREIGAAIGVQTNAVKALRGMGLDEALVAEGVTLDNYEYVDWKGRRLARWSQAEVARRLGAPTVVVHRGDLQRVLLSTLPADVLRLGQAVERFEQDGDGVTARLADGTDVRGAVLVGCDGLQSVVRAGLLDDGPPRYSGWVAFRGIAPAYAHPSLSPGDARQTLGRGCSFGTWHIPRGVYWVGTVRRPAGAGEPAEGRKRHLLDRFASAHQPIADVIESTGDPDVLRHEVYDRPPVTSWSRGRVALLGDAAHPTTPVTGQGGGQAIIDAAVLGEALADADLGDAGAVSRAFAAYQRRREPVTSEITTEAWRIARMHHFSHPAACAARDLSLKLTPTRVWDKRMLTRLSH